MTPRPPCFECGQPSARRHFVVPKSAGGKRYVLLCRDCFAKAQVNMATLTREALADARRRGVKLGRSPLPADELALRVAEMRRTMTLSAIADELNGEGVPTLRDAPRWTPSSVNGLLRRKALRASNG